MLKSKKWDYVIACFLILYYYYFRFLIAYLSENPKISEKKIYTIRNSCLGKKKFPKDIQKWKRAQEKNLKIENSWEGKAAKQNPRL